MASFRFSRRAEADLLSIAAYTLRTWGEVQTVRYIDEIEACCRRLADDPASGRACDQIRSGLRRMEQGRHVLFFRIEKEKYSFPVSCTNAMLPEGRVNDAEADET